MKQGGNITDIHKVNRCQILKIFTMVDKISRVDLSRRTGLNKATITNIINEFTQMGIVKISGSVKASNGRKTAGISLNMKDAVTIVIRINYHRLSFGICDIHDELIHVKKVAYDRAIGINEIIEKLRVNTEELLYMCKDKRILGISIAILGWLFQKDGCYTAMTNGFPELAEADIKKTMEQFFPDYHVILDHDANMSAVAEWKGYSRYPNDARGIMLNIVCGIGFGGGIIIDGKLLHGKCGIAGEVGHAGINFNSRMQARDNTKYQGLFEEYAAPEFIKMEAINHLTDFPNTCIDENSTIQDIYAQYEKDDPLAVWVINRMAKLLAYGLTSFVYILNPDVIVLGDEIIHSDKFMRQLMTNMKENLPLLVFETLDIRISGFNSDSILIGAGIAMTNHYLDSYKMIDFLADNYPQK